MLLNCLQNRFCQICETLVAAAILVLGEWSSPKMRGRALVGERE